MATLKKITWKTGKYTSHHAIIGDCMVGTVHYAMDKDTPDTMWVARMEAFSWEHTSRHATCEQAMAAVTKAVQELVNTLVE